MMQWPEESPAVSRDGAGDSYETVLSCGCTVVSRDLLGKLP